MTVSVTLPPSPPPSRADPANFAARADAHLAWLVPAVGQMNAQNLENNAINANVNIQAALILPASAAAVAAANFKGSWSALTGALNMPASVLHNGQVWLLTSNLANVTTAQPGVSSVWTPVANLDIADRAPIQPSLDLDFEHQRYRVLDGAVGLREIALADILTYTGSGRTYTDQRGNLVAQASNVPRLTFDPITGAGLGLSVWGSRTNIILHSGDPTNWTVTNASANGSITAPDGTTSVPIYLASTNALSHRVARTGSGGSAGNLEHTGSFFIHIPAGSDVVRLFVRARASSDGQSLAIQVNGSGASATFSFISSSSFGPTPPAPVTASALRSTNLGNGWHRLEITSALSTSTTAASQIDVSFSSAFNELTAGTANTRCALFGLQLEVGSVASPYTPTTAAAVTAPADIAQITGANFSKWFNPAEGTFVVVWRVGALGADQRALSASNGTTDERMTLFVGGAGLVAGAVAAAGSTVFLTVPGLTATDGMALTQAISRSATAAQSAANGVLSSVSVPPGIPNCDRLEIGSQNGGAQPNSTIARILYFPRALPANLQAQSA